MALKVVSLNVDSIVFRGRRDALLRFIYENKIDICLAQETKLDSNFKFNFVDFCILRNDDIRGRAGTAIIINKRIKIRNIRTYNDIFHSVTCDFYFNNNWHPISSCYFPPGRNVTINDFNNFFTNHSNGLMVGDFNGRHTSYGDISNNFYGNQMIASLQNFEFRILNPPSPTCLKCCEWLLHRQIY